MSLRACILLALIGQCMTNTVTLNVHSDRTTIDQCDFEQTGQLFASAVTRQMQGNVTEVMSEIFELAWPKNSMFLDIERQLKELVKEKIDNVDMRSMQKLMRRLNVRHY